jgi:CPA2 family monovalent cation:H+ antiporter-2
LTGLVLGESDFRHRIEDNIQPFRDLMLGLFFITVGMQLDTGVFAQAPFSVLLWLAILIPAKILVNGLALRLAKLNWLDAGRGAIILGHGGEFGLLLLSLAVSIGLLQMTIAQPILVAIAISMAAAPLLISTHDRVILALMNVDGQRHAQPEELEGIALSKSLQRHIVICGAGSLGRIVAKALSRADIPHILLEAHYRPYIRAKHDGLPVLYGDASRIGTLQAVGAARAVAVVIAFHHLKPALRTVRALRHQFPKLPLIASVRGEAAAEAFSAVEGVRVFQEEVAAGIALAAQCLSDAGLSPDRVGSLLSELSFELDSD